MEVVRDKGILGEEELNLMKNEYTEYRKSKTKELSESTEGPNFGMTPTSGWEMAIAYRLELRSNLLSLNCIRKRLCCS